MQLLQITWTVITPIFLLLGAGFVVEKKLGFDLKTLTRLNFWIFVPAFLFKGIIDSQLSSRELGQIGVHFALLFIIMYALTWYGAGFLGAGDRLRRAMTASVLFYNSGNYGVPVARLAFAGVGEAVQAIVIMLQNFTNFTVGLALHAGGGHEQGRRQALVQTLQRVLALPMIYTLLVAWGWRLTGWPLPSPFRSAVDLLSGGLVPVALVTLGAQMATLRTPPLGRHLFFTMMLRLVLAPCVGFGLVILLDVRGTLAQALVVSTSFPTAVNSALLAMEFDNEPEYAAAVVFYSTLFSSVTVSLVIYLVRQLQFG